MFSFSMEKIKLQQKLLNLIKKPKKVNLRKYKISKTETLSVFQLRQAAISSDLSEGIISVNLLLDKTIYIQTGEVLLKDGKISSVSEVSRVTSCDE